MAGKPLMTAELKFIQSHAKGMTAAEIGEELGRSQGSIANIAHRNGICMNKDMTKYTTVRKYSDEQKSKAREMYMDGFPLKEISEVTGIKINSVFDQVRDLERRNRTKTRFKGL